MQVALIFTATTCQWPESRYSVVSTFLCRELTDSMKPTLQLRLGTSLTMTPQLQQAIQLLQLSTLDLRQEIQQALESNPMLELDEDYESLDVIETQDTSEISTADSSSEIPEEYPSTATGRTSIRTTPVA